MNILDICTEIHNLLESTNEDLWSKKFETLIIEFDHKNIEDSLHRIRNIYGAASSFNDLILYNDGKVCYEENKKLDQLRKDLFTAIKR